jgi:hypothetical protein
MGLEWYWLAVKHKGTVCVCVESGKGVEAKLVKVTVNSRNTDGAVM